MPERNAAVPGRFVWPEVSVKDIPAAKGFYGPLFGWTAQDVVPGYSLMQLRGKNVAGLCGLGAAREEMGVPSHWMTYIASADAEEAAGQAHELGGRILHAPFDIPGVGRMVVLQDPTGAVFALWQAGGMHGADLVDEPGTMSWNELITPDPKKAGPFYASLHGWKTQVMPMGPPTGDYTIFKNGEEMVGGMMFLDPRAMGEMPAHWLIYFAVADCDASAKKAGELGGRVVLPPTDIPNIGRFAVILDTQGAAFAIIRHAAR